MNVISAIGNTPLIPIDLVLEKEISIKAKLEYLNPGGSMKDRSALYMVEDAEKKGLLKPGYTLIDASSGNHGIAVALIGACKGYKVIITVSEKISKEKLETLQCYGARIIMCPATNSIDHPLSYHRIARKIAEQTPHSVFLDQYFNVVNAQGHYFSLGAELWRQTDGNVTYIFGATGTGGSLSGTGKYFKERNQAVKIIGVDTATSWRATGGNPQPYALEGIGVDFNSPVLNHTVIDDFVNVTDQEAIAMLQYLSRNGLLVGPSSGAVAAAVMKYKHNFNPGDEIIVIFGDSGRAYLSKQLYPTTTIEYATHLFPTEQVSKIEHITIS